MKVEKLKYILQAALDVLDDADDELELRSESNTYFVNKSSAFLGTRDGYISLDIGDLEENIYDAEEAAEDEKEESEVADEI